MTWKTIRTDDRAVSVAVTHILTIGITTILITGLLVAGSGLLEDEKGDASRAELRTIGNRMASEISSAYHSSQGMDDGRVVVRMDHPSRVAGETYNVELRDSCSGSALPNSPPCLVMEPVTGQNSVKVALDPGLNDGTDYEIVEATVTGGTAYVIFEDTDPGDDIEVTISDGPTPNLAPPQVAPPHSATWRVTSPRSATPQVAPPWSATSQVASPEVTP